MGGRTSLIMVIGFAIIFGIINMNIAKLTNRSLGNMIGYNESCMAQIVASAGANAGMALFTGNPYLAHSTENTTLLNTDFTAGDFKNCGYTVILTHVSSDGSNPAYIRLTSTSRCTTFAKFNNGDPVVLMDSVIVIMDTSSSKSFSTLAWMTLKEPKDRPFMSGDSLFGNVHSNDTIFTTGRPYFMGQVTTSRVWSKVGSSNPDFAGGLEQNVPTKDFPDDLSGLASHAVNSSTAAELWVELKPGNSGENNGYAIVHSGSFTGPRLDSLQFTDYTEPVIYSSGDIHLMGTLDGRLSVASGHDVKIEGNVKYETPPSEADFDAAVLTSDMLGIVADRNVWVSQNINTSVTIHGAIFARTGSFEVENVLRRNVTSKNGGTQPRLYTLGSISQKTRGYVNNNGKDENGNWLSPPITGNTGYLKSYHYDIRMNPPEKVNQNDPKYRPPYFPGFFSKGPLAISSWWESRRKPFSADDYDKW